MAIRVSAGQSHFPSPAQDYEQRDLDMNQVYIKNPPVTFIFRVTGDSMIGAGLYPGSDLVVEHLFNHLGVSLVNSPLADFGCL